MKVLILASAKKLLIVSRREPWLKNKRLAKIPRAVVPHHPIANIAVPTVKA
jgi:hypothetical protein